MSLNSIYALTTIGSANQLFAEIAIVLRRQPKASIQVNHAGRRALGFCARLTDRESFMSSLPIRCVPDGLLEATFQIVDNGVPCDFPAVEILSTRYRPYRPSRYKSSSELWSPCAMFRWSDDALRALAGIEVCHAL